MRNVFALFVLITGMVFSMPLLAEDTTSPGTISMQGQGLISAKPDLAFITSGVTTQGKTAREALNTNTESMAELISVLKSSGIEDKDIQTSNFSVQPQYVYTDKYGNSHPPEIVGYSVSNSVSVRIRNIDGLGDVLDQAVSVGANTINSISFAVDDTKVLYNEARKRAMADAIEKAKLYANAANVELGRILNISESGNFQPQPATARLAMMETVGSAPVPVQAGELNFNVTVSVQWELEQ